MIKGTSANLVPYIRYIPCNTFMLHHLTMVIFLLRFNVMCTLLSVTPLFKEAILILFTICLTWKSRFCPQDSIVIPSCEIEWKRHLKCAMSIFSHIWQRLRPHCEKVMHANNQRMYIQGPVLIYKICLIIPRASYLYPQNEVLDATYPTCLHCMSHQCMLALVRASGP